MALIDVPAPVAAASSGFSYIAGLSYPIGVPNTRDLTTLASSGKKLIIRPFVPKADVTIDAISFYSGTAATGDFYGGIYDASGNLLQGGTIASFIIGSDNHAVITSQALTAKTLYYPCILIDSNSLFIQATDIALEDADTEMAYAPMDWTGGTFNQGNGFVQGIKAHTIVGGVLPSTIDPSTFTASSSPAWMGIRIAS